MATENMALEIMEEGTTVEQGTDAVGCCWNMFMLFGWM